MPLTHGQWRTALRLGRVDWGNRMQPPNGTFRQFRMEIDHYSEEWGDARSSSPRSAMHGTYQQRNPGHALSHVMKQDKMGTAPWC
jgi:hypothetical protein